MSVRKGKSRTKEEDGRERKDVGESRGENEGRVGRVLKRRRRRARRKRGKGRMRNVRYEDGRRR